MSYMCSLFHKESRLPLNVVKDEKQVRSLVLWLEDQKIRQYKVEERAELRDIESPDWPKAFQKYCHDVACPLQEGKMTEQLEWLLGFAVRLEYADNFEKYKNMTSEEVSKNTVKAPKVVSSNPLDNMDFESNEFKAGVNSLAKLLEVTPHPDHLVTLRALSRLVTQRLSTEALENPDSALPKGKPFPILEADLGFDTGDYVMNQAAKVLRLLYIHDLRHLQTQINECIVAVQNLTANPKTDTKLGKVGF
ncbi:RNA transcription, translation and transport factor protein isoform X2 [Homalodisca vitripennis]|uniref:RNA transcription, translation and transport factor protein isoform X2 n=1 Tax=Homalodisca vitripennis TaxID=197043 RepID=UPI001EECBCD7|nr:RNA transcription, translation and transport factor protein isoform X2 [Homalodisca vitripennis]